MPTDGPSPALPTDSTSNLARAAKQFARFVVLGGIAAVVNFGSRFLFSWLMPFEIAVICAYCVAAATGFLLFRLFVFPRSSRPIAEQSVAFFIVSFAGMIQTWIVSILLLRFVFPAIHYVGPWEASAHGVAIGVPIITSYFGHKRLTFR